MKLDKEKFLKSELGSSMIECAKSWDHWLNESKRYAYDFMTNSEYKSAKQNVLWCQAQWEVYKMAVRQFYGVEYCFSRTDDYFGICTEDESDWLIKVEREDR